MWKLKNFHSSTFFFLFIFIVFVFCFTIITIFNDYHENLFLFWRVFLVIKKLAKHLILNYILVWLYSIEDSQIKSFFIRKTKYLLYIFWCGWKQNKWSRDTCQPANSNDPTSLGYTRTFDRIKHLNSFLLFPLPFLGVG